MSHLTAQGDRLQRKIERRGWNQLAHQQNQRQPGRSRSKLAKVLRRILQGVDSLLPPLSHKARHCNAEGRYSDTVCGGDCARAEAMVQTTSEPINLVSRHAETIIVSVNGNQRFGQARVL
jgi:hypothetical protein